MITSDSMMGTRIDCPTCRRTLLVRGFLPVLVICTNGVHEFHTAETIAAAQRKWQQEAE